MLSWPNLGKRSGSRQITTLHTFSIQQLSEIKFCHYSQFITSSQPFDTHKVTGSPAKTESSRPDLNVWFGGDLSFNITTRAAAKRRRLLSKLHLG